jgi:hypothetical protein
MPGFAHPQAQECGPHVGAAIEMMGLLRRSGYFTAYKMRARCSAVRIN